VSSRLSIHGNPNETLIDDLVKGGNVKILQGVRYPPEERAVDYVVEYKNKKALVKFTKVLSSRSKIYQELKKLSEELKVNSLIVTDKFNDRELLYDIIYLRNRIGILSRVTLKHYINDEKIFVYEYNGMFYVKIDGKKLKELREKKGYRIHELASMVGISAKTLREYERENIDMSIEKAYRFLEVLGREFEDVVREVDIFSDRIAQKDEEHRASVFRKMSRKLDIDKRYKIVEKFKEYGLGITVYNAIPSDAILSDAQTKFFISYLGEDLKDDEMEIKCEENYLFAKIFEGKPIVIADEDIDRSVLSRAEEYGIAKRITDLEDLAKEIIKEIRR